MPPRTWRDDGHMRSLDPKLLDTAKRSAADVLQDHLHLREAAELEEDLRAITQLMWCYLARAECCTATRV